MLFLLTVVFFGQVLDSWEKHWVKLLTQVDVVVLSLPWQFHNVALDSQKTFDVANREVFPEQLGIVFLFSSGLRFS
jgi:hypothetical protein